MQSPRHGNERMAQGIGLSIASIALAVSLDDQDPATRNIFLAAFGAGAQVGFILPYSRHHENEADKLGLQLMARAGYDPATAIGFWERCLNQEALLFLSFYRLIHRMRQELKTYVSSSLKPQFTIFLN